MISGGSVESMQYNLESHNMGAGFPWRFIQGGGRNIDAASKWRWGQNEVREEDQGRYQRIYACAGGGYKI